MSDTALATVTPAALVPSGPPRALILREALAEAGEQRKLLSEYIRDHMVEGTDYGVIPGTKDKSLLKPGAEKLVDLYRCTARVEIVNRIENWERGLFHYEVRVRIEHRETGVVFAEGVGSCNSMEAKYRWRTANRRCPSCSKESIIRGKAEYGGGWLCFAKKGGCGAKFKDGDQAIEGQESGRVENDDPYTHVNTVLKMAKKRGLVDAALTLGRVSDLFTQDVEDIVEGVAEERRPAPPKASTNERIKEQLRAAPDPVAPARVVDVAPGETEEQATARVTKPANEHHAAIRTLFRQAKIDDPARIAKIIEHATGKRRAVLLDRDDVDHVQSALQAIASDFGNAPPR